MVSTRSGTGSSPAGKAPPNDGAGTKRKAENESSPASKREKKTAKKEQKTIEETMPNNDEERATEDAEMREADKEVEASTTTTGQEPKKADAANGDAPTTSDDKKPSEAEDDNAETADKDPRDENGNEANGEDVKDEDAKDGGDAGGSTTKTNLDDSKGAVQEASDKKLPSNIIERGIIYFFTRGRVGVNNPDNVQDLQRSFLVLRPLPEGTKLGEGPIQDLKNNRLIAIPKKVLPKSHTDRFMVFVEKGKTTIQDLKENFFQGSKYETKTSGTRETPPVTPVGEGVYAITSQDRSTHLAYLLTIPESIGEVQRDMGISNKGSFLMSLKNPQRKGPANASLPESPDFPKDILDEFRGLAWMPVSRSEHLDYPNAQFLLIGEGEEGFEKATEPTSEGNKSNGETAYKEMEELEHEDELRVEKLHGKSGSRPPCAAADK
jgi:hypothetical protein